ncbi:PHP domain-containing protein [Kosmotoga pacifica]|uniref:Polymerase/histidinol phosphatase N-terminal domain-containing protein n=1 Tax=Kosmotoga pacifica TaxID=1330330 RepID=A0A0G2Z6A3_9BACT|nr:phosphatase [Kosmotoga pacifica]AKI97135.1 hypothetical protein IX53_04135 [Kosmotoga pacifica]
MLADLHMHSHHSDGTKSVEELVEIVLSKKIRFFSITDHDNMKAQHKASKLAEQLGLTYVSGIEIGCRYTGGIMDILGYNVDYNDRTFLQFLEKLIEHRDNRNELIVRKLNELGFEISMSEIFQESNGTIVGRPHISRVMLKKGYVQDLNDAFEKYIGEGRPAYVDKNKYRSDEVISYIRNAGGIAILAHPFSLNLEPKDLTQKVAELVSFGLQGIEVFYKEYNAEDQNILLEIAKNFHLLVTGGSDYHGDNKPDIEPGVEIPDKYLWEFISFLNLQKPL